MMKRGCLFLSLFTLCLAPVAGATTRYVDDHLCSDTGSHDYYHPYCTIQVAINDSHTGDVVIVRDGTYHIDDSENGVRRIAFSDSQAYNSNITVRSANGPENCIIDCQGSSEDQCRGFDFHHDGAPATAVVDGFTITNGYINGGDDPYGGARGCPIRS